MNVFINTIVFVKDIARSKLFYNQVLGLKIVADYQTIVFFENHFTIHIGNVLLRTIFKRSPMFDFKKGKRNIEIYFETEDIEKAFKTIVNSKARVIHPIEKQAWGQKVFRFYDPDKHIIEIGEPFHEENIAKENSV